MNSLLRGIFLVYFATHIPITLSLDLQVILGDYYPEAFQNLFSWYCTTYNDQILGTKPIWLKSFIWAEFLFQTPFFFVATYAFYNKCNWIRIPSIMYGSHVATTVWALLAEFIYADNISTQEKMVLFSFYSPYLVVPVLLMLYMGFNPQPFGASDKVKKRT
mmetsp:Transcript_7955/g.13204  ORF Transcript_7955/g.13204 Transcript_7955/m.13204 type:complete len:161 (+) Transcript_7955:92-574(+)